MAHNISNSQGVDEVFTAKTPAWHGLGVTVAEAPTWQDASRLAHLDWTISKRQFMNPVTGDPVPSHAIIRDDTGKWLSTVGEAYVPIQNSDCFEFCDALIATGNVRYESAGALGNGEVVWCLAKLNNSFEPVKGDVHETYLLFTDNRNGKAATVKLTTVRVVCQNTLSIALSSKVNGEVLRLRHTAGITDKLTQAKVLLTKTDQVIDSLKLKMSALSRKKVTVQKFESIMEKLFPGYNDDKKAQAQNKAAMVASNFMNAEFDNEKGSAFALLQAVTHYIDHQRGGLRANGGSVDLRRKENALFGKGDEFKQMAFNTICSEFEIGSEDEHSVEAILQNIEMSVSE